MEAKNKSAVEETRSFSRFYTEVLGLLNKHILDSPYSLTEVRILYEIDKIKNCTANILMHKLNVDRGYMSRILKHLEKDALIIRENSSIDGRSIILHLTSQGKSVITALDEKSSNQIEKLINHLTESEQENLVKSMKYIKKALSDGLDSITIRAYETKDIEFIIKKHRDLYEAEYGFGPEFGDYVEEYMLKFNKSYDPTMENIWVAEINGLVVGVIAIVKVDNSTAQLRWFLIEPEMRGKGLGHRLMKTAIDFSKGKDYTHVFLWTVDILKTARHLYKNYGFTLTETKENNSWGSHIIEERWDLYL